MPERVYGRVAWAIVAVATSLLVWRYPARLEAFHAAAPVDFMVYMKAVERVLSGLSPYVLTDPSPYKYAPGILGLVKVLPSEPDQAWVVFSSLSIIGFATCLLIGARYTSWKSVGLLALGLALAWKGILETMDYGQFELLILSAAVLAGALRLRHPVIAGLIAGSLPWLKLPWILLLLPLIISPLSSLAGKGKKPKRIRLLISGYFFAWFIWGAAVPSLTFGTDRAMQLTREWYSVLAAQPHSLYFSDINQSLWISAIRWMGNMLQGHEIFALSVAALIGAYVLGCLVVRNLKVGQNREVFVWLSPWLLLTQLVSPLSWRWGSVFVVGVPFAIAVMSKSIGKTAVRSLLFTAIVVLWMFQLNPVVRSMGFHHWTDLHPYGLITLYWGLLLILCLDLPRGLEQILPPVVRPNREMPAPTN